MKIKTLLLFLLLFPFGPAKGGEPVDSYLSALVQGAGSNLWWVYPKEIEGQTITPPKGGYLLRIKVDLNADGLDEVFLTTDDDVKKDGQAWTVYRNNAGSYAKLNNEVWLRGALWEKTDGGVRKFSYFTPQNSETTLEEITTLWFDAFGNFHTTTQQVTEVQSKAMSGGDETLLGANGLPDENKIAQYLILGSPVTLNIEKVLVGKLFQDPNMQWRGVNSGFALSQQFLDPADAADIASLANWTPPPEP